jgi:hypothetical protein
LAFRNHLSYSSSRQKSTTNEQIAEALAASFTRTIAQKEVVHMLY